MKLKVRVIKINEKFYPQYAWEVDENGFDRSVKNVFDKMCSQSDLALWSKIEYMTPVGEWKYVKKDEESKDDEDYVFFEKQDEAIAYAKSLKDKNDPKIVWSDKDDAEEV